MLAKEWSAPMIESLATIEEVEAGDGGTPAVIVHGMGDAGTNPGMKSICATVGKKYPGGEGRQGVDLTPLVCSCVDALTSCIS